jgi:hypothetical protein
MPASRRGLKAAAGGNLLHSRFRGDEASSLARPGGSQALANLAHADHLEAMRGDELFDKPGLEGGVFLGPYVGLIRLDRLKIAGRVEMQREICEALGNCGEDLPIGCFGVDLPPPLNSDKEIQGFSFDCVWPGAAGLGSIWMGLGLGLA